MVYVTISAKINKELHEKLKKYGISVSKVVRRALEEEARRAEEEEVKRALERLGRILVKMPPEEIANSIRESREER
ncbi:MAG: type II toxin-antitoxin system CcdA family antitoxin [Candidatus Bathyarchaeia archaeon]|nr:type II toxin-antitoxin system CcdA family antitoxin [Candidatus Bathyarchaeota archaeon]